MPKTTLVINGKTPEDMYIIQQIIKKIKDEFSIRSTACDWDHLDVNLNRGVAIISRMVGSKVIGNDVVFRNYEDGYDIVEFIIATLYDLEPY